MAGTNLDSELATAVKFYLGDAGGTTYTQIPGNMSPGPVGDKASFKDATTIDMTGYKSIAALSEPEDRELKFKFLKDNTAQEELRTVSTAKETRKVKVEFTPLGTAFIFEMVFGGWIIDEPEFNEEIVMTVYARKNTSVPTTEEAIAA